MLTSLFKCFGLGAACLALAACSGPAEPIEPGVYKDKPVSFPVSFRGSGVQQVLINKTSRLNIPVACRYKMGSQTGKFTTPAVVELEFTDKRQVLELDCKANYIDRAGLFNKTFKGEIKANVQTSFDAYDNKKFLNWHNPEIIVPTGPGVFLRRSLIGEEGVQLLPTVIIVDPDLERVWKNGEKREKN